MESGTMYMNNKIKYISQGTTLKTGAFFNIKLSLMSSS